MSDETPTCVGCKKNDQVVSNDVKRGKARHWICLRCNLKIRKPRL